MAPPLPDRFHLEIRLGRFGDVEAWLATDETLDRPVLVEWVGPDLEEHRRDRFLRQVRAAASISHVHLAAVFAAASTGEGAYAVTEWAGGVTVGDRLRAGESIPANDFLPNAAGLSDALATLHRAGIVHGAISPDTILFSAAHPAKLAGFGRSESGSPEADTRALADALVRGVTGGATDLPPSQVAEGLPPAIDRALASAAVGTLDAAGLASALRASPSPRQPGRRRSWSWRWLGTGGALLASALIIIAVGFSLDARPDSPFLFPAGPGPTTTTGPPSPTSPPPSPGTITATAASYDPFGDGEEGDADLGLLTDGDPTTGWRTERYFDPLRLIKPGVGVLLRPSATPRQIELIASEGIRYQIDWAAELPDRFEAWEEVASGSVLGGAARSQLPAKDGGIWLLWLTDLPAQGEFFYGYLYEVRFEP